MDSDLVSQLITAVVGVAGIAGTLGGIVWQDRRVHRRHVRDERQRAYAAYLAAIDAVRITAEYASGNLFGSDLLVDENKARDARTNMHLRVQDMRNAQSVLWLVGSDEVRRAVTKNKDAVVQSMSGEKRVEGAPDPVQLLAEVMREDLAKR